MERDSEVLKNTAEQEGLSYSELLEVMTIILEEKLEKQKKQFKEIKDKVKYKQREELRSWRRINQASHSRF